MSLRATRRGGAIAVASIVAVGIAMVLGGCASGSDSPPTAPVTSAPATLPPDTFDRAAAAQYCGASGGVVQSRQPMFGTNNDQSTWVDLGEPVDVCRFQANDEARSRIYVDLVTLYSRHPTLAALAYLSKTPLPKASGGGNPAAALCTALGGASDYGSSVSGGGLVDTADPVDVIVSPCVFADESFIDEWGIAYYSGSIIRGTDLSKLFRFDARALPPVFAH